MILGLLDEAMTAGARLAPACAVLCLDPRTVQRWMRAGVGDDRRAGPRAKPKNALSEAERAHVLTVVGSPEFRDKSPKQIVPMLADRGEYIACESTVYRILRDSNQLHHREPSRELCHRCPRRGTGSGRRRRARLRRCAAPDRPAAPAGARARSRRNPSPPRARSARSSRSHHRTSDRLVPRATHAPAVRPVDASGARSPGYAVASPGWARFAVGRVVL